MSAMGDIDDIKQVKYRYLRALDTKNWEEFADTLTEDGWKISATGYDHTYDASMSLENLNFELKTGPALNI